LLAAFPVPWLTCVNHKLLLVKLYFYGIKGTGAKLVQILSTRKKTEVKSSKDSYFFSKTEALPGIGIPNGQL
jgi:hypothetical protein